jgi:hypothetical protein
MAGGDGDDQGTTAADMMGSKPTYISAASPNDESAKSSPMPGMADTRRQVHAFLLFVSSYFLSSAASSAPPGSFSPTSIPMFP